MAEPETERSGPRASLFTTAPHCQGTTALCLGCGAGQDKGNQESWQGEGRFCNLKME